jgi:uncharacterized Zn-binding protein involved in type VI secretion
MFGKPRRVELSGSLTIALVQPPPPTPSLAGVWIASQVDGFTATVKGNHMAYTLPDDKHVFVAIAYVDAKGNPAAIDGDVSWASSDQMICNVGVMAGDSTKADLLPGVNLGQAQITASADADLGAGTTTLLTTFDVIVVSGTAVSGTITPQGDPQPITTPTPRR